MKYTILLFVMLSFLSIHTAYAQVGRTPKELQPSVDKLVNQLSAKHGEEQRPRILRSVQQVAGFWRIEEDGSPSDFESFITENYIADQKTLDETFTRLEFAFEQLDGHMLEINREFRKQTDLDIGPILPIDEILSGYSPAAHVEEDFFGNKLAFIVLLNFPLTTLEERLTKGDKWSRREWAEVRLAQRFEQRVPASVNLDISGTVAAADRYISEYNIWMHHLLTEDGKRLFPPKLRLITHWNLRDELKANYSEPNGLPKQQMIQKVMERIVTQTIPAVVINNPHVDWNPFTNQVSEAKAKDSETAPPTDMKISDAPEPDNRYRHLLNIYQSIRKADPYSPTAPTLIKRRFDIDREIPEERVRKIFETVLTSPLAPKAGALIEARLGRKLQPFDIWYNGFKPRGKYTEEQLDKIVREKYPTAEAFQADIPNILKQFGFSDERANYLASMIIVDPSRGAGHAMGAQRRGDKAHLRTRVEKDGMNYKGYNIAVHELGHNIEQTFSLNMIDHNLLEGVPNTAFTEALAFVFQGHDLELLGLAKQDAESNALKALNDFWQAYEMCGVGLVDMTVWNWMYDHPDATPAQLKEATIRIAKDIWNKYYASVYGVKDVVLLGIYSHMIDAVLYLPDYPIGRFIAFQVEGKMGEMNQIGPEFERVTRIGRVTPDLWMKEATGTPVSPDALLQATEKALVQIKK